MTNDLPILQYIAEHAKPLGETFDENRDGKRLCAQAIRVYEAMKDGQERTLEQISELTGDPQASVSARLRSLRGAGFTVERKYIARGLHSYRLVLGQRDAA
jgi:DNA-binding transcriptional ArsR family regulator